jgi:membrane-associated protein
MEYLSYIFDFFVHINVHLDALVASYGTLTYAILFIVIFCETGLVVTPFLPGDSLLFAAGAVASRGGLDIALLLVLFISAGILGDTVNYWLGHHFGESIASRYPRLIRREHLDQTHQFFERYGGKTIILARFVPIVRTLAPFVAGAGSMTYSRFMYYNVVGGVVWALSFTLGGYYFANIPLVRDNFSIVLVIVLVVSVLPPIFEFIRAYRKRPLNVSVSAEQKR